MITGGLGFPSHQAMYGWVEISKTGYGKIHKKGLRDKYGEGYDKKVNSFLNH